jgi:hypothetical protein
MSGAGWRDVGEVVGGRGRVALRACEGPAVLLVDPSGAVGPGLLREVVGRAAAFGEAHPDGWCYVVDTRGVWLADPRNGRWLRRIHRLPNIRGYLVVAPGLARPALRLATGLARRGLPPARGGPQAVHATVDAAVADARRRLAAPPG